MAASETAALSAGNLWGSANRPLSVQGTAKSSLTQRGGDLYNNNGAVHAALNIVHEFGHFINVRLGGCPSAPAPSSPLGELWILGNPRYSSGESISKPDPDPNNDKWLRGPGLGQSELDWQQNDWLVSPPQLGANEEVADMFLSWVYDIIKPVFQGEAGAIRREFMNNRMTNIWISQLASQPFPNCQ